MRILILKNARYRTFCLLSGKEAGLVVRFKSKFLQIFPKGVCNVRYLSFVKKANIFERSMEHFLPRNGGAP